MRMVLAAVALMLLPDPAHARELPRSGEAMPFASQRQLPVGLLRQRRLLRPSQTETAARRCLGHRGRHAHRAGTHQAAVACD